MRRLFAPLFLFSALALSACGAAPTGPVQLYAQDGSQPSLRSLAAPKDGAVLIWWSNSCPCVRRYNERAKALAAAHDLPFYYVASNAGEGAEAIAAAEWATLPVLLDEGGRLAQSLGVTSTPTAVLLDGQGEVIYRGWIDNEREPGEKGREPWLEQALARKAQGDLKPTRRPTWGCRITRSIGEASSCHSPTAAPQSLPAPQQQ